MAIQEHRCFSITCDVCKKTLGGDEGGEMHFETAEEAVRYADNSDWHTTATNAVCFTNDSAHHQAMREHHAAAELGHQCWPNFETAVTL